MLNTTMFLGYACNRLGTYFNLLVWLGALENCGTLECLVFSYHYKCGLWEDDLYVSVHIKQCHLFFMGSALRQRA